MVGRAHIDQDVAFDLAARLSTGQHVHEGRLRSGVQSFVRTHSVYGRLRGRGEQRLATAPVRPSNKRLHLAGAARSHQRRQDVGTEGAAHVL